MSLLKICWRKPKIQNVMYPNRCSAVSEWITCVKGSASTQVEIAWHVGKDSRDHQICARLATRVVMPQSRLRHIVG